MTRRFDPDGIRRVAGQVGGLSGDFNVELPSMSGLFGELDSAGTIDGALSGLSRRVQTEFSAGAEHMTATETALQTVAQGMADDEQSTVDDMHDVANEM